MDPVAVVAGPAKGLKGDKETAELASGSVESSSPTNTPIAGSGPAGRIKAPPVCVDASLKQLSMSTAKLSEMVFPPLVQAPGQPSFPSTASSGVVVKASFPSQQASVVSHDHPPPDTIPVSSSSSTCTKESDATLSDAEGGHHHALLHHAATTQHLQPPQSPKGAMTPPPSLDRDESGRLNAKVSLRKTSRQGRSTQRWLTDPSSNETVRLVTGCVPILKDGKILLVSSSRKSEWIIPKGGWETDERIEESAVRECFEEAGVLGTLGPRLKEIQYETRKAKKRRLEQEEMRQQQSKRMLTRASSTDVEEEEKDKSVPSPPVGFGNESTGSPLSDASALTNPIVNNSSGPLAAHASPISSEDLKRIRGHSHSFLNRASDAETVSVASNLSSTYNQVRLALFPLYVSEVHDEWPESGRLRTAVDIDVALKMLESRPEFKAALEEVRDRGLHLVSDP